MSSSADSSPLTKGKPLDLAIAALLTALLCACADVAFELWLQGTALDVPAETETNLPTPTEVAPMEKSGKSKSRLETDAVRSGAPNFHSRPRRCEHI